MSPESPLPQTILRLIFAVVRVHHPLIDADSPCLPTSPRKTPFLLPWRPPTWDGLQHFRVPRLA